MLKQKAKSKYFGFMILVLAIVGIILTNGCVPSKEVDIKLNQIDAIVKVMNERLVKLDTELEKEKPDYSQAKVLISGIKSDVDEIKKILAGINLKIATETQKRIMKARQLNTEAALLSVAATESVIEGQLAIEVWGALLTVPDFKKINFAEAKKELKKAEIAFNTTAKHTKAALEKTKQIDLEVLSPEAKSQIAQIKTLLQEDVDAIPYFSPLILGCKTFTDGFQALVKGLIALEELGDLTRAKAESKVAERKFLESAFAFKLVRDKGPIEWKPMMIGLSAEVDILSTVIGHLVKGIEYAEQGNIEAAEKEFAEADKLLATLP